jgi:hypothetical protein
MQLLAVKHLHVHTNFRGVHAWGVNLSRQCSRTRKRLAFHGSQYPWICWVNVYYFSHWLYTVHQESLESLLWPSSANPSTPWNWDEAIYVRKCTPQPWINSTQKNVGSVVVWSQNSCKRPISVHFAWRWWYEDRCWDFGCIDTQKSLVLICFGGSPIGCHSSAGCRWPSLASQNNGCCEAGAGHWVKRLPTTLSTGICFRKLFFWFIDVNWLFISFLLDIFFL